jgi:hypothetical protein
MPTINIKQIMSTINIKQTLIRYVYYGSVLDYKNNIE